SLLFLENRALRQSSAPWSDPSVDWGRSAKAVALYAGHTIGLPLRVEGGSTLAVQLEKYRHSPDGRTRSGIDKLRQTVAASLRAYRDGPDTRPERRRIVLDYLNSVPLASTPDRGEVFGLGEG